MALPGTLQTLYVATSNPGKLRDFAAASTSGLAAHTMRIQPLHGLEKFPAPVEDADTFAGNASLKAIEYSRRVPGVVVLADDSGLEVDALNGAPGVYSARFAAMAGFPNPEGLSTDACNNACLLEQMISVPTEKRAARYRCVLAAAQSGVLLERAGQPILGDGTVEGLILEAPRGIGGFGYDPLFFLPQRNLTMAEMALDEKITLSHRGRALKDFLNQLRSIPVTPWEK